MPWGNVAVLTEDGAFAFFFRPHPGKFDSSRVLTLEICHPRQKKCIYQEASPEAVVGPSWNSLMHIRIVETKEIVL